MATRTRSTRTSRRSARTSTSRPSFMTFAAVGIGAVAVGALLARVVRAAVNPGQGRRSDAQPRPSRANEHVPTDLLGDSRPGPGDRAAEPFRPDPLAVPTAGERDAFRPALAGASAPTLVKGEAKENERADSAPA